MRLKILSAIVISSLSINALAQEGQVQSNTQVRFEKSKISHKSGVDWSTTRTDNASGNVGNTISIKTNHSFSVTNDMNYTKNYVVLEKCEVNGKNYIKGWGFSLPPHGSKSFSENVYLDYHAKAAGSWRIDSTTCVANSSACSFDHATLAVN